MKKLLLVSLCFLFYSMQIFAQNRTITGTVTAKDDGGPLPGVSVKAVNSSIGVVTGADGKFSITVPAKVTSLQFSFIGYSPLTKSITGSVVNASLSVGNNVLGEVVVTGVGTATLKTKVAIDVATVSNKDFAKSSTTNVTQALVGQIAGAQIIQSSGQPGAAPTIILRGYTNLGSSAPLIMIDGIQAGDDALTYLDPSTVDHIEVVKGSAGGMLYGSQGGNGVIQIFTKKGAKNGKLTIDFASKYSSDKVLAAHKLTENYHHYVTDAAGNILTSQGTIVAPDAHGIWPDPQELPYATDPTVQNNKPFLLPTYDHTAQGYKVANTFTNSLNIRGGSEKADYAFNVSNLSQQDVYSNLYNRTNMNLNVGFNPVKGLTFRNNTQLFYTHENLLGGGRFNLVNSLPYIDFNFIDPTTGKRVVKPSTLTDGNNELTERDYHERYSNTPRIVETMNLNYKFPKFVEIDIKGSTDDQFIDGYNYYHNQTGQPQAVFWGNSQTGSLVNSSDNIRRDYGNASAFFRTDFKNDFHLNIPIKTVTQVSYDFTRDSERYFSATGSGLNPYPPANIEGATTKTSDDYYSQKLLYGFLVNQTIEYANLVGISGGFRSDYSSVFGSQSNAFTYPRGTIFVNPSELFSGHNLVTNWKLRGAYGEAGVQPSVYLNQVTFPSGALGTSGTQLILPGTAYNPALAVQVTKELEIGTDLTMTPFKGQWVSSFTLSASYWNRKSNNDIQKAQVAQSTGFNYRQDNLISLKSNGLDLSLDVNAYKSNNFDWNLGARFATAKTVITALYQSTPITSGVYSLTVGQELGTFIGQTPLHSVDQLKPDGTRYIPIANVGNYTMVDGNVVSIAGSTTNQAVLTASNDQSVIGNANPKFTASLINRFTVYKKLTVSVQFDWKHGNKIYNETNQWLYRDRVSADFDKPVTINGKTGSFVTYYNSYYNALAPDSWFVEDGSFIRLRDLSVSYDITNVVKQKWLRSLIVTASGRNLATWTKYKGLDPENTGAFDSQGGGLSNIGSYGGVDYYGAPNVRSYQFSLNIGF